MPAIRIANTNDFTHPAMKSGEVDDAFDLVDERHERNRERLCIVNAPPSKADQVGEQRQQRRHQHRGDDRVA